MTIRTFNRADMATRFGIALAVTLGLSTSTAVAQVSGAGRQAQRAGAPMNQGQVQSMITSWPQASRLAAMDMMKKYGPPSEATATMLMWKNNGPWKWTKISNKEVPHRFPMPHPDVMEQAIDYKVPIDRFDDLARYDGSVIAERTKGELSARCDKEGANFLAINLANDVATGKRTVEDARAYYTRAIDGFMKTKKMDPYMTGFKFRMPSGNQADADIPTIAGK